MTALSIERFGYENQFQRHVRQVFQAQHDIARKHRTEKLTDSPGVEILDSTNSLSALFLHRDSTEATELPF